MSRGRIKKRQAKSLHGELHFERNVYECSHCRGSLAPLDKELGLGPHEKMTRCVVKKVAYEVAQASHPQASKNLAHQAELDVSSAECARVAEQYGKIFDKLQREREKDWVAPWTLEKPSAPPERYPEGLIIEADATTVLTVSGEENKMVYCATAFDADDRVKKEPPSERPMIVERQYCASGVDFEDFRERFKAFVQRMGVSYAGMVVFIGDGAPCLWNLFNELLPNAVLIQDFWHVLERLKDLVKEIWGKAGVAKGLARKWGDALRASQLDVILNDLEVEKKRRRGKKRKLIETEIKYLITGRERMDYARFEREGLPIGSGAVEGTCKHLVKQRYNLTGARWKREKIPNVLALRLSLFNEEWEEDWRNLRAA